MNKEEKKAIKNMKVFARSHEDMTGVTAKEINIALKLIEKQQKEIKELKWECNYKYYHTIKCRELEKEINNGWKDKINKLKEEVETELISNPYDFSYLLNEILEEK